MERLNRIAPVKMISMAILAGWVLVAGCSSTQQPVRVFAGPTDLARLRGEWVGEYNSAMTGRSGTIYFSLEAKQDTAYGSVVMLASRLDASEGEDHDQVPSVRWKAVQALSISFIAVDGGLVRGTLEPYMDPNCNCTVTTTFVGKFDGDTIVGTYSTMGSDLGWQTTGVWKIVRKTDRPAT